MELRYQIQEYCLHEHKNNQLQGISSFQKHVATVLSLLGMKVNEKEEKSPLNKKIRHRIIMELSEHFAKPTEVESNSLICSTKGIVSYKGNILNERHV